MVKITKKTDYGLTLMTALAKSPDQLQSLKSISKEYNLPYKFIGQVASALLEAGLIISKEGATGGYKLSRPAQKISLQTVMATLDGPVVKVDCLKGKDCARSKDCGHKHIISSLSQVLNDTLKHKTVADLVL